MVCLPFNNLLYVPSIVADIIENYSEINNIYFKNKRKRFYRSKKYKKTTYKKSTSFVINV